MFKSFYNYFPKIEIIRSEILEIGFEFDVFILQTIAKNGEKRTVLKNLNIFHSFQIILVTMAKQFFDVIAKNRRSKYCTDMHKIYQNKYMCKIYQNSKQKMFNTICSI